MYTVHESMYRTMYFCNYSILISTTISCFNTTISCLLNTAAHRVIDYFPESSHVLF